MSASEASREDRQLEASQRRIDQAREEGQLPRSRELVHLAAAGALLALLLTAGPWLGRGALDVMATGLRFDRDAVFEPARMLPRLSVFGWHGLMLVLPIAAGIALLLAAASVAVGGWNFTLQALEPKFERLDPMAGFGRLVSRHGLLEHLRTIVVASALIGAAGWYLSRHGQDIQSLAGMPLHLALSRGFGWIAEGIAVLAGVSLLATLADVPLQVFKQKAELRMTHDEARQEHKEAEGDPHMKGERRRRARELSRGRMLSEVPAASVVVTNPTHYAVALRYDDGGTGAPRIVAMGADLLALKIREVAGKSRVPVLESPPLARALYKHGEVGKEVPVALYTAVAQVLAWVYGLRNARRAPAEPVIEVPQGLDPHEERTA
jgi:flagellar biosynthetic protein FlhB